MNRSQHSSHNVQSESPSAAAASAVAVKPSAVPVTAALEPFQVNRKGLNVLFSSPRLVKRMLSAGWITVIRAGKPGREAFYEFASAKAAFERYRQGEEPPLLPYEQRGKETGGAP